MYNGQTYVYVTGKGKNITHHCVIPLLTALNLKIICFTMILLIKLSIRMVNKSPIKIFYGRIKELKTLNNFVEISGENYVRN